MHSNGDNIYLTSYNDVFIVIDESLSHFVQDIKVIKKHL